MSSHDKPVKEGCKICKTPLLVSYCREHEPSWLVGKARNLDLRITKLIMWWKYEKPPKKEN